MGGVPGFTAVLHAKIIYSIKCIKVSVQITKKDKCYNELPVVYNNFIHGFKNPLFTKIWNTN